MFIRAVITILLKKSINSAATMDTTKIAVGTGPYLLVTACFFVLSLLVPQIIRYKASHFCIISQSPATLFSDMYFAYHLCPFFYRKFHRNFL